MARERLGHPVEGEGKIPTYLPGVRLCPVVGALWVGWGDSRPRLGGQLLGGEEQVP